MKTRRLPVAGIVTACAIAALGGIGYAAIPDTSGTIHACYNNANGEVHVIDTAKNQKCLPATPLFPGETAINWNQTGPQGPVGPAGPQGPAGPGAQSFTTTIPASAIATAPVAIASDTVSATTVGAICAPIPLLELTIMPAAGQGLAGSGTDARDGTIDSVDVYVPGPTQGYFVSGSNRVNVNAVFRSLNSTKYARYDLHGQKNTDGTCTFWGMITPSS